MSNPTWIPRPAQTSETLRELQRPWFIKENFTCFFFISFEKSVWAFLKTAWRTIIQTSTLGAVCFGKILVLLFYSSCSYLSRGVFVELLCGATNIRFGWMKSVWKMMRMAQGAAAVGQLFGQRGQAESDFGFDFATLHLTCRSVKALLCCPRLEGQGAG